MQTFEINGEEHELKLDLKSVQYLNGLYNERAFGLIQRVLVGDMEVYVDIVFAGLFHTGKGFKKKDVEKEIGEAIKEERLDLDQVLRTCNEVVAESFFYKKTVEKLLNQSPEARKQLDVLLK